MESVFTLPYSEYAVINEFSMHFGKQDGFSIYVPASRQEKGVDFLLHYSKDNTCLRFQVKSSRAYVKENASPSAITRYRYNFWFNNFVDRYLPNQADFYVLFGLYPVNPLENSIDSKKIWRFLILCIKDREMKELLDSIKTIREKKKDRSFGIGFDTPKEIFGARGFPSEENSSGKNMTPFLLEQQVQTIKNSLLPTPTVRAINPTDQS